MVNKAYVTGVVCPTPLDLVMNTSDAFLAVVCRVSCMINTLVAHGKGIQTLCTHVLVFLEL